MKSPTLRFYPDPCLFLVCEPVEDFDGALSSLADKMGEIMRESRGAGLAANQVGVMLRLVVMDPQLVNDQQSQEGRAVAVALVNPVLLSIKGVNLLEEGCLSLPEVRYQISERAEQVEVQYQTLAGELKIVELNGLGALCIQHEIDHLDGLTMLDRLSSLKAGRAKAKLLKMRGRK